MLQESSILGEFPVCLSNLTSLIVVMILFCFVWPERMIKKKKVKQGVPPQASLLVHYLILMEMVVLIYVIKMLFADGQNNFMLFFCNEFHKLLNLICSPFQSQALLLVLHVVKSQ